MASRPALWARLLCRLHGEVPADTLEAYRRTSLAVFDLLDEAEQRRNASRAQGVTPWGLPIGTQAEMLCAWNAYVLQSLGNQLLEADYREDPKTVGYVPPVTADQVLAFYAPVEAWLSRARQAGSNPEYELDVAVPAELPPWSNVEPCPESHRFGLMGAMRSLRDHATRAMASLPEDWTGLSVGQRAQMRQIRQVYAGADAKARYAEDLHGIDPSRDIHDRVEPHVKEAIEQFYLVGQLLAMPHLATNAGPARPPAERSEKSRRANRKRALPGETGFNPWCLTDPLNLDRWQADPKARRAIKDLWRFDPDPARTLAIAAEIEEAEGRGDIARATDRYGKRLGHFYSCPWGPVYVVKRPVTIGGKRLRALQEFVFDVTADGMDVGTPFTREIVVGDFQPTTRTEYGDRSRPPDH